MLRLKQFRSSAAGLPDLLSPAALIDSGIILGKDGSLLAGFTFRGQDPATASNSDRNYITGQVNAAILRLGEGWAMWTDILRVASPGYPPREASAFPDPITALIDEERRVAFEADGRLFESDYVLTLKYLPPKSSQSRFESLVYSKKGKKGSVPTEDRALLEFKRKLEDIANSLGDLLNFRRLGSYSAGAGEGTYLSDGLVNWIHTTLTGRLIELRIPDCPMYLDSWLGYPDLWVGDVPVIGGRPVAVLTVDGFPGASTPGMFDLLEALPLAFRWSQRFIFLEQRDAEAALNRFRLKWQQKMRGFFSQLFKTGKGLVNTDAIAMAQQTEAAINEVRGNLVAYGYYTAVLILIGDERDAALESARIVRREFERRGFSARIETVNATMAWLGSIPGETHPNVRRPLISTQNLADLLPLSSIWPGHKNAPCPFYPTSSPPLAQVVTTGSTPHRLNLHSGDVGHTLIFGPTGAGKSTLLAFIAAQFRRYPDATITAFDKGCSMLPLCLASGGAHYDIGSDTALAPLSLAPLADIDTPSELLFAEEWLATCFSLQTTTPPTPSQKSAIHRALVLLQDAPRKNGRSLTHFCSTCQDEVVRDALRHYTLDGPMGSILDGEITDLEGNAFQVFEIDSLLALGIGNALPVLLYLFRRFELSLKGQPSMLILDEAWVMLGHPVFREKIREWLKVLRRKNCAVVMATQSLSDASNSGLLDVLVETCPTKIMLPNREAGLWGTEKTPGPADLYTLFGLNGREIEMLKTATPKRQYFVRTPDGRRLIELGLGPIALAFLAVSDSASLMQIRQLAATHGAEWPEFWLRQRGVSLPTDTLEESS